MKNKFISATFAPFSGQIRSKSFRSQRCIHILIDALTARANELSNVKIIAFTLYRRKSSLSQDIDFETNFR